MTVIELVEGWTGPLDFQLMANGSVPNLTGCTVELILRKRDGTVVDTSGDVAVQGDPTEAIVRYTPEDATVLTNGPMHARFKVIDAASKVTFFPSGPRDKWELYQP